MAKTKIVALRFAEDELKELDELAWKARKNRTEYVKTKLNLKATKASKK